MIKNTPYFRAYLKEVDENNTLISASYDPILKATSDYYEKIGAIKYVQGGTRFPRQGEATNATWLIKPQVFKTLDEDEQDLITNIYDKNKDVLLFVLEEVALEENLVDKKVFENNDEARKWLKANSSISFLKNPTKAKMEDISLGAASTVLPIGLASSIAFGIGSAASLAATLLLGAAVSVRSLFSVSNRTREFIVSTDFYVLNNKGLEVLNDGVPITEIKKDSELEYLEVEAESNKSDND